MTTQLTPKQRAFLRSVATSGRFPAGYDQRTFISVRERKLIDRRDDGLRTSFFLTDAGREALKEIGGKAND